MSNTSPASRMSRHSTARTKKQLPVGRQAGADRKRSKATFWVLSSGFLVVVLGIWAAHEHLVPVRAQNVPPAEGSCCGKKPPSFKDIPSTGHVPAQTYSAFTGQIAVVTGQLAGGSSVLLVDLKNENAGIPVDANWSSNSALPTHFYYDPRWATATIGDVFGVTLDNQGDIYVTATTAYLIKTMPAGGGWQGLQN